MMIIRTQLYQRSGKFSLAKCPRPYFAVIVFYDHASIDSGMQLVNSLAQLAPNCYHCETLVASRIWKHYVFYTLFRVISIRLTSAKNGSSTILVVSCSMWLEC